MNRKHASDLHVATDPVTNAPFEAAKASIDHNNAKLHKMRCVLSQRVEDFKLSQIKRQK
jgi:hypothetical protein